MFAYSSCFTAISLEHHVFLLFPYAYSYSFYIQSVSPEKIKVATASGILLTSKRYEDNNVNGKLLVIQNVNTMYSKQLVVGAMGCRSNEMPKHRGPVISTCQNFIFVEISGRRSNGLSKLSFKAEFRLSEQRTFINVPLLRHPVVPTKIRICRNTGMSDLGDVETAG